MIKRWVMALFFEEVIVMKKETKAVTSIFKDYRSNKKMLDVYEQMTSPNVRADGVLNHQGNQVEREMIRQADLTLMCHQVDDAVMMVSNPVYRVILRIYLIDKLCKASFMEEMFEMTKRTFQYHRGRAIHEFYKNYLRLRRTEN